MGFGVLNPLHMRRPGWVVCAVVAGVAIAINLMAGIRFGLAVPMASDAEHYLDIARSLATGHGYTLPHGFWPDAPTMSRSPVWPSTVALALRLLPHANPDVVMRILDLLLNSLVAVLVAILAGKVLRGINPTPVFSSSIPLLSGLFYALYPTPIFLACQGASEIIFLALALAGTILVLGSTPSRTDLLRESDVRGLTSIFLGMLLLGLAALARPNFILWIGFAAILFGWHFWRYGNSSEPLLQDRPLGRAPATQQRNNATPLACFLLIILFLLPSCLWAVRNYGVCGHFPVLSTLRGQTLYGGNNAVVAESHEYWGYWVFPDVLPGETRMEILARSLSEYGVDCYYTEKGKAYIRSHLAGMPLLVLGKLTRAYVPIPWKPTAATLFVSALRWLLYGLAWVGLVMVWKRLDVRFKIMLGAMVLTNVATVVLFWGCARFALAVEPFMIPFCALALVVGSGRLRGLRNPM